MRLEGKTAIVTGGASGFGEGIVRKFLAEGAEVMIADLNGEKAAALAEELGCYACAVDVSDWANVEAAMITTLDKLGRADILVNSAGVAGSNAPLAEYPVEEFRKITEINLLGTFHVNRAVVSAMERQGYGRIVNIASVAGKEGNPNASAYSASKAGVIGLTKSLGKELAGMDIAVNCFTPAAARTRIFDQMKQEHIDYMLSKIPRGRFLELDEAAAAIAWYCSKENSFTTAAVVDLSGGRATY